MGMCTQRRRRHKPVYAVLLIMLFFHVFPGSAASSENPCTPCHQDLIQPATLKHPAFSFGCLVCHDTVPGKEHPDEKESVLLKKGTPDLCYTCHDETKFQGKYVHAPVSKGECTSCHSPHSSETGKLLKSETPELCFSCHKEAKFSREYTHSVAISGCGQRCHNPHANMNQYLLPQRINELCIGCHSAQETGMHIVTLPGGRIHPIRGVPDPRVPTKELSCASCHNPHSAKYSKLYKSRKNCRRCHKLY